MSRKTPFISARLFARAAAPAVAALMLASCQTTTRDDAIQGDAIPVESASNTPTKPASAKTTSLGYTDPLVASAAGPGSRQGDMTSAVSSGDGSLAAYAPAASPGDLGELTLQPTSVNASRTSLFSPAPAVAEEALAAPPAGTAPPADTQAMALADGGRDTSTSIVVTSELPTRQVNPMSKSLFSAELRQPQPPVVEQGYLPPETPVYAADETPIYEDAAAAPQPATKAEHQVAQAAPADAGDPAESEQPKKHKWLASLKAAFAKKKE